VPTAIEIRPLEQGDDRTAFCCGQPDLDRFFRDYAGQNQFKWHLAVTYVATVEDRTLGFATVAASSLERKSLPSVRLRRRLSGYPLSILRLARLGVDARAQRLGVGRALLGHVLGLALDHVERIGCVGVVTDAKPDAVSFYEPYGFTALAGVREGALQGKPTPMFLPIATIAAARSR